VARLRPSRRSTIVALVAALVIGGVLGRHVVIRSALEIVLSAATGYDVSFRDQHIGFSHAALFDVHVRKNGDPLLDAARVDVEYALRDIFPGGQHRFGFAAVAIQNPVLTITRHADGSLTFRPPGGGGAPTAAPPASTRRAAAPYYFTARFRNGVIRLVDQAPQQPDLATQTIVDVSLDASVKSDARTTAHVTGVLLARHTSGAPLQRYPLEVRSLIDVQHGFALTRLRARELPLRGPLGFIVHTHAVRFDDGRIDAVNASAFALAVPGADFTYTLGGTFVLREGRMVVSVLRRPLRDLQATFTLSDTSLTTPAFAGSVAGVPLHGRGALFDLFAVPRFRMAVSGDGPLAALRTLFAFSAHLPVTGSAHLETLLAAQLAKPLIEIAFSSPRFAYGRFPVDDVTGYADYYNASLLLPGIHARYGAAAATVGGHIDFRGDGNDIALVANARGAGISLPYTNAFAPDSAIDATALISEPPGERFNARGTVAATGATLGALTFAVDQYGVGEFGPFSFSRSDGSSLAGAFELARPISASAGWLHFRNFPLQPFNAAVTLPGARIPILPPLGGIVDGDIAGGGTPSSFGLAGTFHGRDTRIAGYDVGTVACTLGGTVADMRLSAITIDGPLGRFTGDGAYGQSVFAAEGRYDGRLAQLQPFTRDPADTGEVHATVRAAFKGDRIAIQTTGADLAGARVRGVPVTQLAGTLYVAGKSLRIVAVAGTVAGGRAVAGDAGGPFLISAPALDAAALRGAGLPLQAGRLAVLGSGDLRGITRFDGGVALDGGRAAGYPVSGSAELALAGSSVTVRRGGGALGTTFGSFAGRLDGLGQRVAYDLDASVPDGEIADLRALVRMPVRYLEGSFAADVHLSGSGAHPYAAGNVRVPEGSYNGLAFSGGRAAIALTPGMLDARNGSVTVGTTHAQLAANVLFAQREFALDVRSPDATLSDFNDYFDEADVLGGRGPVAFAFSDEGGRIRTDGRFAISALRYRRLAFGQVDANWAQQAQAVHVALAVHGTHGSLHAAGTLVPARGSLVGALRKASYHATLDAQNVDLGTWLPALGSSAPILGSVDLHATIDGRSPQLVIAGDANVLGGSLYGYTVKEGVLHARSDGTRLTLANSILDLGFARFDVGGTVVFARDVPLALSIHGQTPDLASALATAFPKSPRYDVGGTVEADVRITGTMSNPRATAGFNVTDARYKTLAVPRILGSATYDGKTLEIDDAEATFVHGSLLVAGSLPLRLEPFGVASEAPLSFTLALTSLDLAPFSPFVPGPATKLSGTADARLAIDGTLRAPRVVGRATLANGAYTSPLDRAGITAVNAQLTFSGTSVALDSLHAKLGNGTLDGNGSLDLPFPGVHTSGYTIALTAHNAGIDSPQYVRGTVDGTLQVASAATMPIVSGTLTLSNASIPFSAVYKNNAGTPGEAPFPIGFDLTLAAGRNVRVQSSIIDVGATGQVVLTGTLAAPKLDGLLTATPGGIFSTYNRVFRVQEAAVRFDPAQGVVPYVDLRAYAHVVNPDPDPTRNAVGSADITVTVRGPADELAQGTGIVFSSSPPYSQEQILGLLLDASVFGAVNFGQVQNGTTLPGAPGESNALNPPGTTVNQTGVINFNQEAFSVLNGQFTQRFLAPLERVLGGALNLTDLELTVDYGGGVGYTMLKQIGHRDVYASFGQTLTYPERTTAGFTSRPNATTSIQFNYYTANGDPQITNNENGTQPFTYVQRLHGLQPLTGRQGFTFSIVRKYP